MIVIVLGDCIFLILGQHGANGEFTNASFGTVSSRFRRSRRRDEGGGAASSTTTLEGDNAAGKHERDQDEYDIGGMKMSVCGSNLNYPPTTVASIDEGSDDDENVAISSAATTARQHRRRRANDDSMTMGGGAVCRLRLFVLISSHCLSLTGSF